VGDGVHGEVYRSSNVFQRERILNEGISEGRDEAGEFVVQSESRNIDGVQAIACSPIDVRAGPIGYRSKA
jgi:hypothetical protein